jgi:hypothetical protein
MHPVLKFLVKAIINFLMALNPVKTFKNRRNDCHVKMTFPPRPMPTMTHMKVRFIFDL